MPYAPAWSGGPPRREFATTERNGVRLLRDFLTLLAIAACCGAVFAGEQSPAQQSPAPAAPGPLSLQAAITAAQQVSALQQAEIDERVALEDVRQAKAALLPRARDAFDIFYNSPLAGTDQQSFIAQNAVHEYQNLLGVTGTWNFGLISAVNRSRALLAAARAGTEVARHALIRGVGEAYYGAALASAKRVAAEQSLAAAEEFQRVTALNQQAGEVPEVDVIRARLQTAARRDDLAQARQAEAVAYAALGTLLGYGITGTPPIEPLPQNVDMHVIERFTAGDVLQRPEFAQLDAQVRAARADVSIARASLLPSISYSLDEGFDTPSLSPSVIREHRGVLATASVDVPIFDWGGSWSRIRQAQLRARGAELQRLLTSRDLYLQFATARQEALTAAERVDITSSALADAERNVSISIARYRSGEGPIVEATDALTTLANNRLAHQQALYDYQIAITHLREASGQ